MLVELGSVVGGDGLHTSAALERQQCVDNGVIVATYQPSDTPAQVLFNHISYSNYLYMLCPQGAFGKLPAHAPARQTLKAYIMGMEIASRETNYTYFLDANGCVESGEWRVESGE